MEPEKTLPTTPEQLREALLDAAVKQDWDQADAIAPLAAGMNGDYLIKLLGSASYSANPDVRDAVMTTWSYIEPEQHRIVHFRRALEAMKEDNHECVSIWAAVTVCRYVEELGFKQTALAALKNFKDRIAKMDREENGTDWQETRDFVVGKTKERVPQLGKFI